jgi:hypothetical protein
MKIPPTRICGSQVVLLYPLLFNILLEFLARAITQEQEELGHMIRGEHTPEVWG